MVPTLAALITAIAVLAPSFLGEEWGSSSLASEMDGTGLPIPRFVSLRAEQASLRTGPGKQYPVKWVYQRPGLPLEVVEEFDHWRKVRDWQGAEGWMHTGMLSGRRGFIVVGSNRQLHADPDPSSPAVAEAEPKVVGLLKECPSAMEWCRVQIGDVKGWINRSDIWGLYKGEIVE